MLQAASIKKIGQNKGQPRIWIEGSEPAKGGFLPGTRYNISINPEKALLTIDLDDKGMRIVSGKTRGEKSIPIIDINSHMVLSVFGGLESVRVVVQDRRIMILPVASELRAKQRLQDLRKRLDEEMPLLTGSTSSGIGILDLAAYRGLKKAGIETTLAFANEIREDCMEHACERNAIFEESTITLTMPMQELAFDEWMMSRLPKLDLFVAGVPCSGASVAGRTKRALAHPESHPDVGHLVVAYLALIAKLNPAICVLENVMPYRNSASMDIIRNQLRDLGYDVHETELDAADWNMLEHRKRMCMVAVTKGIEFSFDGLEKPQPEQHTFGEVMDQVDPSHSTWGSIAYLWSKQERDAAAGKGFAPTVVDEASTKVPTLNKPLHKRQSTGTFIRHPGNPELYRIPTVAEHARCKGIDETLVEGTTQTFGHETLGQSISMPPFISVFELLGKALKAFRESSASLLALVPEMKAAA